MSGTWCSTITSVIAELVAHGEEAVAERVRLLGAEPGGGLVEQEEVGPGRDGGRDLDDAHRAVREVAEALAREVVEAEQLERELGRGGAARARSVPWSRGRGCPTAAG